MINLDIHCHGRLLEEISKLAIKQYGEDSQVSRDRVVETALEMRILWSRSVKQGQELTGEAVSDWEFPESLPSREDTKNIQNRLFRR